MWLGTGHPYGQGTAVAENGETLERGVIARGIALRIAAAGFYSIMAALLKLAAARGVVAVEMLFYRAAFGLPVVLGWVIARQGLGALATKRPLAHVGRSVLGISSILCTFQALIMLPLGDATTIGFTAPVFATILSWLVLREPVGLQRWLAVLCGFIGVAIVMRPGGSGHALPIAGVGIALVAALGTASVTITLRQLRHTENVAAIVFWFFLGSALVGLAFLPFFGRWHDATTILLLAGGGIAGGIMQITMTSSLQAPVSVVSPFDYLQMVGAVLLGWLLMASVPTVNTLVGAALIACSGLYTALREHRLRHDRPVPATQPIG
jgi:drug/metabolite transporter (DMT)-like permease